MSATLQTVNKINNMPTWHFTTTYEHWAKWDVFKRWLKALYQAEYRSVEKVIQRIHKGQLCIDISASFDQHKNLCVVCQRLSADSSRLSGAEKRHLSWGSRDCYALTTERGWEGMGWCPVRSGFIPTSVDHRNWVLDNIYWLILCVGTLVRIVARLKTKVLITRWLDRQSTPVFPLLHMETLPSSALQTVANTFDTRIREDRNSQ